MLLYTNTHFTIFQNSQERQLTRPGDSTQNRRLGRSWCNGDISPTTFSRRLWAAFRILRGASTHKRTANPSDCEDKQKTRCPASVIAPEPHRRNPQPPWKLLRKSRAVRLETLWLWRACIYPQFAEHLSFREPPPQMPQSRNCHSENTAKSRHC